MLKAPARTDPLRRGRWFMDAGQRKPLKALSVTQIQTETLPVKSPANEHFYANYRLSGRD